MDLKTIIWLASFPKSGNTWTRVLLANYFLAPDKDIDINHLNQFTRGDIAARYYSMVAGRDFVMSSVDEWLALRPQALRLLAAEKDKNHFVKTHATLGLMKGQMTIPPEVTAGAIYIFRNPFDVAISYARHMGVDIDRSIEMMTDRKQINGGRKGTYEPVGRWDEHIQSWVQARGLWRHVMRYEDMIADTERAMRGLLTFLHAPIETKRLRRAIERASFENLQKQEQEMGFREKPPGMEQFFASGKAGGWRGKLTVGQVARIRAAFLPTIEKYYPDLAAETAGAAAQA